MEFNLLPWREESFELNRKTFITMIISIFIFAIVVLFFLRFFLYGDVNYASSYYQSLLRAKNAITGQVQSLSQYKILQQGINDRGTKLRSLLYDRYLTVRVLNELNTITPQGIYFTELNRNKNNIEITGIANSNLSISSFMNAIESSKLLKTVSLTKVEKKDNRYTTETQFDLKLAVIKPTGDSTPADVEKIKHK